MSAAVLIATLGGPALGSSPRTEQKPYVTGPLYACGIREVCFYPDGSETTVDLKVVDRFNEHVGAVYYFLGPNSGPGTNLGRGHFCDSITGVPWPDGANVLFVTIGESRVIPTHNECSPQFPGDGISDEGTMGTVTAIFR